MSDKRADLEADLRKRLPEWALVDEHDQLVSLCAEACYQVVKTEYVGREGAQMIANICHDLTVVMQAAWIDWRRGNDAVKALAWIENSLEEPGLVPTSDAPHADDGQAWFDHNRSDPWPPCEVCGAVSRSRSSTGYACSRDHQHELGMKAAFGHLSHPPEEDDGGSA